MPEKFCVSLCFLSGVITFWNWLGLVDISLWFSFRTHSTISFYNIRYRSKGEILRFSSRSYTFRASRHSNNWPKKEEMTSFYEISVCIESIKSEIDSTNKFLYLNLSPWGLWSTVYLIVYVVASALLLFLLIICDTLKNVFSIVFFSCSVYTVLPTECAGCR